MAAGGAGVREDSFIVDWIDPHAFENCFAEVRVGGAEVGQMDVGFRDLGDEGQIKRGGRITGAANSDQSVGVQRRGGEHIVVGWGWGASGAVRADIDERALKIPIGTFLLHAIGDWRQDFRDGAWSAPGNDVFCASSGAFQLGMGEWHVDLHTLTELERGGIALEVKTFCRCTL